MKKAVPETYEKHGSVHCRIGHTFDCGYAFDHNGTVYIGSILGHCEYLTHEAYRSGAERVVCVLVTELGVTSAEFYNLWKTDTKQLAEQMENLFAAQQILGGWK